MLKLNLNLNLECPVKDSAARRSEAMAHRRCLRGRVGRAIATTLAVGAVLAGSVYVADQTTRLRDGIERLEADRDVLNARYAETLQQWNAAVAPAVITRRAEMEIGLEPQARPDMEVAVEYVDPPSRGDRVLRLLEGLAGGETAHAGVIIAPRSASFGAVRGAVAAETRP